MLAGIGLASTLAAAVAAAVAAHFVHEDQHDHRISPTGSIGSRTC
jgi:hypothetical protein